MFNSKYYLIVIVIAFICLACSVGIQVLEMKEYNLVNSLPNRFFKKSASTTEAAAPAAKKTEAADKAAPAPATPAPAEKK